MNILIDYAFALVIFKYNDYQKFLYDLVKENTCKISMF